MEEKCLVCAHHTTQVKHVHLFIKVNEFRAVNNLQSSRKVYSGHQQVTSCKYSAYNRDAVC